MRVRKLIGALVVALWLQVLAAPAPCLASAPSPAPLIVIDPGHGGRYSNANANGLREKHVNLAVALELRNALIARGYRVMMTRYTDRTVRYSDTHTWNYRPSTAKWSWAPDGRRGFVGGIPRDDLQARVDKAGAAGADLFISIHSNGSVNRRARGTETWASPRDYLGRKLAPFVTREVVRATGLRNRGSHTADFYVCRWSNMPAVLVETGFISNSRDARLLKRAWFRKRLAGGIANGVDAWMHTGPYRRIYPRITAPTAELADELSRRHFPAGAQVAVVVPIQRADDVPGAAALAVRRGGPLLMTPASGPATSTAAELARLAPERVIVAGVEGSFDATTVAAIALASGIETAAVDVIAGPNAVSVSASIAESMGVGPTGDVLFVSVTDRYSKLVAASVSAAKGIPLLLTEETTAGAPIAAWIAANRAQIDRTVIVGKAARLPGVRSAGTPGPYIVDGPDYAYNAARLNARYFRGTARGGTHPVVATIPSTAQYLAAVTYAARMGQPLAPVWDRKLPSYTREWITNRRAAIGGFEILTNGSVPNLMDRMLAKSDVL